MNTNPNPFRPGQKITVFSISDFMADIPASLAQNAYRGVSFTPSLGGDYEKALPGVAADHGRGF